MAKKKEQLVNPIQIDKDIYHGCKAVNEKYSNTDFKLGGTLVYLNKLYKNVKGFEHTNFDFKGTGEEFVLYVFLTQDFISAEGVCPFFSNTVQYFG
mmetsp:Transcript_8496/g.9630  ORF Transcript_8496/g.9630 Transcript_8496/m.9630 type:complete len:96 (+) Transcript_8496:242-529(+)